MPLTAIGVQRWLAELSTSTETVAEIISGADLTARVPTCPDWSLRQLATHIGRAQRWAAQIVATRVTQMIPFSEVADGRFPPDPAGGPDWLRAGPARLAEAVAGAGEARVWAFGGLRTAGFWARRMAHETAVHRADAQLTAGMRPVIDADIAADGIAEWLEFTSAPPAGQDDDPRAAALAGGRSLHLHATDAGLTPPAEWVIRESAGALVLERGHAKADTAVRGPASDLLLLLVRRISPGDPAVDVIGDPDLLDRWLAATPF